MTKTKAKSRKASSKTRKKTTSKKTGFSLNRNLILLIIGFLLIPTFFIFRTKAQVNCHTGVDVVGATTTMPGPVFCTLQNVGQSTSKAFANAWEDRFDHGLSFADVQNTNYSFFKVGPSESIHWLHANHWMVDVDPEGNGGGAAMRPNQSFKFENNKFVVESVVAAGIREYSGQMWPEIVISTNPTPNPSFPDLYLYDALNRGANGQDYDAFGIRLQDSRYPIAAYFKSYGGRFWEISSFQHVGESVFGGHPGVIFTNGNWVDLGQAWNECVGPENPDTDCRDRFRIELGHDSVANKSSVTLYVNGAKYFEQTGLPAFSPEFLNGDLYVYMGSVHSVNGGVTVGEVARWHWDDIIINPHSTSYGQGGTGGPAPSPTPAPSSNPSPVPSPVVSPSPSPLPSPDATATTFMKVVRRVLGVANTPENNNAILSAYYSLREALGI